MSMGSRTLGQVLGPWCRTPAPPAADGSSDGQLLERFRRDGDETAFALLVQRHGPMVLGVCQRVLKDSHDAEDAFQATFLVLVRKAASLRRPDSLAGWLHGVAYRTALKARAAAARRRAAERQTVLMPLTDPLDDEASRREVRAALDEELDRLPEKYRAPLVLCYLEGKTNEDAARQLGWPAGSMSYRLTRGRELVRRRLDRRGLALAPLAFAALLGRAATAPAMPDALARSTVQAALRARLGQAAGVSAPAAELVGEVLRSLTAGGLPRWALVALACLAGVLLALGVAYGALAGARPNPPPPTLSAPAPPDSDAASGRGCSTP